MPGFDGTGPRGYGQVTGRGFGPCGTGRKFCFGRGSGFGLRYLEPVALSKEEERKILKAEKEELEKELEEVKKRLK